MATRGPRSVLDRRSSSQDSKVIIDRITRSKSPVQSERAAKDVVPRISQPYRTSFSAVVTLPRVKRDSGSSTAADFSSQALHPQYGQSKSPNGRRISPRRVTYDDRVVVRHSDTEESIITDLSGHGSSHSPLPGLELSKDSFGYLSVPSAISCDYSNKSNSLHPTSDVLSREQTPSTESKTPGHGILKDINKRNQAHLEAVNPGRQTSNGNTQVEGSSTLPESPGWIDSGVCTDGDNIRSKTNIMKDYVYDRTISYRLAIQSQYSDEVKRLAEAMVEEKVPGRTNESLINAQKGVSSGRIHSASMDQGSLRSANTSDTKKKEFHISHTKTSLSTSVGNFFKRISPNLRRKTKERTKSSSTEGSAQSLNTSDSGSIESNPSSQQFERSQSKSRKSFLRLLGKSRSQHKVQNRPSLRSTGSSEPLTREKQSSSQDINPFNSSTNRILKSIEQNTMSDKTVYQKFKEKQSPHRPGEAATVPAKAQAVKPIQPVDTPEEKQVNKENENLRYTGPMITSTPERPGNDIVEAPPSVTPVAPNKKRMLQKAASTASADESIGECSLDVNLTGSEPSLLSNTGQPSLVSKQVILSNNDLLVATTVASNSGSDPVTNSLPEAYSAGRKWDENEEFPHSYQDVSSTVKSGGTLKYSDSCDAILDAPARKPSYLKLSCSVSGYGKYSSYNSYKGIEKRSPFSSSSSLKAESRSTSFEMPIARLSCNQRTPSEIPSAAGQHLPLDMAVINGHITGAMINGRLENFSEGNPQQEGSFFLQFAKEEEDRLLLLSSEAGQEIEKQKLPEEVCGKIRAAIGKAHLLIDQKFKQLRELCHQHMSPSELDRPTKREDLQGFWEMVQIQVDDVTDMFAEIELMKQNGWKEVRLESRRSSSSSQKSTSVGSTPSHTPGSKRKVAKAKDTPESSPERTEKARQAAKARDEARRRMLADKRAAMRKQTEQMNKDVKIFVSEK